MVKDELSLDIHRFSPVVFEIVGDVLAHTKEDFYVQMRLDDPNEDNPLSHSIHRMLLSFGEVAMKVNRQNYLTHRTDGTDPR